MGSQCAHAGSLRDTASEIVTTKKVMSRTLRCPKGRGKTTEPTSRQFGSDSAGWGLAVSGLSGSPHLGIRRCQLETWLEVRESQSADPTLPQHGAWGRARVCCRPKNPPTRLEVGESQGLVQTRKCPHNGEWGIARVQTRKWPHTVRGGGEPGSSADPKMPPQW